MESKHIYQAGERKGSELPEQTNGMNIAAPSSNGKADQSKPGGKQTVGTEFNELRQYYAALLLGLSKKYPKNPRK